MPSRASWISYKIFNTTCRWDLLSYLQVRLVSTVRFHRGETQQMFSVHTTLENVKNTTFTENSVGQISSLSWGRRKCDNHRKLRRANFVVMRSSKMRHSPKKLSRANHVVILRSSKMRHSPKTQSGKSRRYLEVVENATITENSVWQMTSLSWGRRFSKAPFWIFFPSTLKCRAEVFKKRFRKAPDPFSWKLVWMVEINRRNKFHFKTN